MQIEYKNQRMRDICTNASTARKRYGDRMAAKIHQRIDEILAIDAVETLVRCKIGRCHALVGDREGQYAMDLIHPQRLVFIKLDNEVQVVRIEEITDYH